MAKMNLKEFWEETKKDKKKLFFIIVLPLILIISIVIGVVSSNKEEPQIAQNTESSIDGVLTPVDSTNIQKNKKKTSQEIYKESFWEVDNKTGKEVDFFGDLESDEDEEDNNDLAFIAPTPKNTYVYQSPYDNPTPSYNQSKPNNNPPKVEEVEEPAPEPTDGRRRRTPSDSYGNMSGTNSNSIGNSFLTAVIANDNRAVKERSYVSIRLGEETVVDGMTLPRNTIITGITSFRNERMIIKIGNVRSGSQNKVVNWSVYDNDGVEGILIPENILSNIGQDAVGETIDKTSGSVNANVPFVGGVKVNLSKKNKDREFILNDGHKIYIKPN